MKILGTGLDGLVGSRIVKLLRDRHEFENLSFSTGVDITDRNTVFQKIKSSDAQIVLHLAAKTDVDDCELDKPLREKGDAWKINVLGTQNIVDGCSQSNKKIIYISTDFVFDGTKKTYSEEDTPNPINWYAKTKYEGEKIVQNLKTPWMIVRIAYPYRAQFERLDFARAILKRLQEGLSVAAVTDHIFTPTHIDDIASAFDMLINKNSQGVFHVVGNQSLTPYDAALLVAKTFDFDQNLISKTTRKEFFKDRAQRPFQLRLKNDKITELGVRMRTFEQGLREIKYQMSL
ncbi:MAG: SDR family oxidoreductase [Candidatus Levybacteria bacterium]|nr:SDR family oxidoreductase [Candidatus Levybacteria bacterium]MDZ4227742.1 SDR family oxidoreductase [Candidatus Levybacteria bacterium]